MDTDSIEYSELDSLIRANGGYAGERYRDCEARLSDYMRKHGSEGSATKEYKERRFRLAYLSSGAPGNALPAKHRNRREEIQPAFRAEAGLHQAG